jgi:dipeptidyl aminopeptidase/acylaminoacyl peptidase
MSPIRYSVFILAILLPACSTKDSVKPDTDATPPARVEDLAFQVSTDNSITLSWTAPGDDGDEGQATQYEIRYSTNLLSEASWDSATIVASPPVPKPAGQAESFAVSGLADGTWYLGLKAADEVPNWSAMSNIVSATLADTIPPATVTDLAAVFASTATVDLSWTAPGDDGDEGMASAYDLRYALSAITEESWDDALQVQDVAAPDAAGSPESFSVTDLELGTQYFFAIKAVDESLNWSELSNVVDRSTANLVRLTTSSGLYGGAMNPSWSPDGQTIAFDADWEDGHTQQLYVIPASGGEPVRLTNRPQREGATAPRWSPDRTQLAFISHRADFPHTLQELSIMDAVPDSEPVLLVSHGQQRIIGHGWSPDGSQIAYTVEVSRDPPIGEMYIIPSSGGYSELLLRGDWIFWAMDWSPDGSQIAFTSNRYGNNDIWVVPASGGYAYPLTVDPAWDNRPAWSPDGTQIAFGSGRAGKSYGDIWLMSSTGWNSKQLIYGLADESAPSWSPDARRIAFTSWVNGLGDIWVVEW